MMKMKKTALAAVLLMLVLAGCTKEGNVRDVNRVIGPSALYTGEEISEAMDTVLDYFEKTFTGCTMSEIRYDEEKVISELEADAEAFGGDEAIVLLSDYTVDESGGDGSLDPGGTYENWGWILTRTAGGAWEIQTYGYG